MLMQQVRGDLAGSQFEKAYSAYQKKVGQTEDVEQLLNLGLLAFEAGDYAASQSAFENADRLAEERQTKSLSREAAGIAVSDRLRAYQGTDYDKAMLHYYRALAYLAQDDLPEAVVEGRRIASYLEVLSRDGKHTYRDDAFLQWFNGSLYESYGQANDAWISYNRARELYRSFYDIPEPSFLCPVSFGAAQAAGLSDSETAVQEDCPGASETLNPDDGRVIVICETGIAPPIEETNIVFPIFTSDNTSFADDGERERFAEEVYHRRDRHDYGEQKLKYLLRVALPIYAENYSGSSVSEVVIRDDDSLLQRAEVVSNVGAVLRQDLVDRYPAIAVRAIIRALIKYAAKEGAEQLAGKDDDLKSILGAVVNAAGVLSEAADTRSWETLPDRIYAADFQLSPGTHQLRVQFDDASGGTVKQHDFPPIEVKKGAVTILRVRCTW
jgi:hypothetical protein